MGHEISIQEILPVLLEKLKQTDPEKIVMFGSRAHGNASDDSDLDILVVTSDKTIPKSFAERSKIYLHVSKAVSDIRRKFPIDLIVHTKAMHERFNQLNSLFSQEIKSNGIVLYEKVKDIRYLHRDGPNDSVRPIIC